MPGPDPPVWLEDGSPDGRVSDDDRRWLARTLGRLMPLAPGDVPTTFCHGDVNNVVVATGPLAFHALIEWSGAGWLDPA